MKRAERQRREADRTMEKIRSITRHIKNVEDNCLILGERLILSGSIELGKTLIANGFVHDASKFHGIEWENMTPCGAPVEEESAKLKMKLAIRHHQLTNPHHVEYWTTIDEMPDVYLAELVCDTKARSEEFGTSLRDYIDNVALKRWNITKDHKAYKRIMEFVNMLCERPFQEIK